jgi:formate hydrogenlyase subunit 4
MYKIILEAHAGFRYLILLILVFSFLWSLWAWLRKANFAKTDNTINLVSTIAFHVQLVFGIILYFLSPLVQFHESTMRNDTIRFWTVEHALMMVLAVVIVTLARMRMKKLTKHSGKHRLITLSNLLVLVLVFIVLLMGGRGVF